MLQKFQMIEPRHGSNGRTLAKQVRRPEFVPQYSQKKKINLMMLIRKINKDR
jgi:hypothetical protein